MKATERILGGDIDNRLYPFFWLTGPETLEDIEAAMVRLKEAGCMGICVESRDFPDFEVAWWEKIDFIMPTAERLGMKVWIVDEDTRCPCGHVFGLAAKGGDMKLRRENLVEMHADVVGPCKKDFVVAYTNYRRASENKDKLIEIYETAIKKECAGMDRRSLHANLNRSEFKLRERDFGSFPIGVANALSVFEAWCYGGNCATGLVFEEDIATVRQGIDSGMAESLLKKMTVENETRAEVLMLPDPALGEKREKALKETLRKKLNSLTEKELEEIKERQKEFTLWQESEDSEEALAALPTLALSDVTPGGERQRSEIEESRGATLLRQKVASGGISYLSLFLKADDLSELWLLRISVPLWSDIR